MLLVIYFLQAVVHGVDRLFTGIVLVGDSQIVYLDKNKDSRERDNHGDDNQFNNREAGLAGSLGRVHYAYYTKVGEKVFTATISIPVYH